MQTANTDSTSAASGALRAQTHVAELDGVRALAVWMVVMNHLVAGWPNPEGSLAVIPKPILFLMGHGWLGVDLFFVLSGFLITGILLDSRGAPSYFRTFYARRILRIVPLYYTVLLIAWLCYPGTNRYFVLSLFYLANFSYFFRAPVPHGPSVFWSLSIEEHFYLVWPCLVRVLSRRALTLFAVALVAGVPLLRLYAVRRHMDLQTEIYLYTWFRVDGLALGALLAIWVRSRYAAYGRSLKLAAGLVGISAAVTIAGLPLDVLGTGSVLRYTQVQMLFAAFLLGAVTLRDTAWTAALRSGFARLSGDLSYCIYLTHLSIGDGYEFLVHRLGWQPQALVGAFGTVLLRSVFVVAVSFGIALLSRKFLEGPALRLKRYFEYSGYASS